MHPRWLYTLFLMCDVNFRAKLKDRGFDDFELGDGWSYFTESAGYQQHLVQAGDQTEVRLRHKHCMAFKVRILTSKLPR